MVGSRWPMLNLMCRQAYEPQLNKQSIFFWNSKRQYLFFSVFDSCFVLEVCMTRKCIFFFVCVCVFCFSWAQRIAVLGQVHVSIRTLLVTSDVPFSKTEQETCHFLGNTGPLLGFTALFPYPLIQGIFPLMSRFYISLKIHIPFIFHEFSIHILYIRINVPGLDFQHFSKIDCWPHRLPGQTSFGHILGLPSTNHIPARGAAQWTWWRL